MVKAAADKLVDRLASKISSGGAGSSESFTGPQSAEELKLIGSEHFQAGRLTVAGSYYRSAIRVRPAYAEAHNNLGAVLRKRDKPQSAIAAFQNSLMLNPRSGSTYANLANLHERYGNIAQAETYYLRAVELDSRLHPAFLGLARIATTRKRWDDALAALTRAAALAPQSAEILHQTGVVNIFKKDYPAALNSLRNAEGLSPKNADIKASLADVLQHQGQDADAKDKLTECFAIDPENQIGLMVQNKMSGPD